TSLLNSNFVGLFLSKKMSSLCVVVSFLLIRSLRVVGRIVGSLDEVGMLISLFNLARRLECFYAHLWASDVITFK
ncbi:MAG: hypothetical protein MK481_12435, partial [SAR324 cluster bacterium]|nr:hypothetical protein [SAR324 cluster bacterium]